MKARSVLLVALGIALVGGMIAPWVRPAESQPTPPEAPRSHPTRIRSEGRLVAYPGAEVAVGTEVAGTIARVLVSEKATVKAGELLAEIAADEQRAALDEARARIDESDAQVSISLIELR